MNHRRLTSSSGNDLLGCEVKEIPWIGRVVAWSLGIGIVVEQRIQAEIVEIRKRKARTSVKESIGRKIVEIDAIVFIIGIELIFVAHVVVEDVVRVTEVSVVAKWRAVGELKIENAVAQRDFSREKCWRRISHHHDGACHAAASTVRSAVVRKRSGVTEGANEGRSLATNSRIPDTVGLPR